MHVDTGHNFHEVLDFRDQRVARAGRRPGRRQRAGGDRQRHGRRAPDGTRNRIQTPGPARRARASTASPRSSAAHGATRTRPARRSESPSGTSSVSGTRKNQRPELWSLYNGRVHLGESIRVFPLSNWTELDIWRLHQARGSSSRRSTTPTSVRSSSVTGCCTPCTRSAPRVGEAVFDGDGALPHRRRRQPHRGRPLGRRHGREGHRRGGHYHASPSAARPAATTSSAKPPWRTASGRGTSDGRSSRFATAGSVDDGKSTLIGRLLYDTKTVFAGPDRRGRAGRARTAATSTSTSRCSRTACAPSASRASRSTSPTATSPRPTASSSSPTPRGTSSTPATW